MPDKAESDNETYSSPVEGRRACPVPRELIFRSGPWSPRPAKRRLVSTGVVSADVVEVGAGQFD
ncbi:hypothetical protein [Saccharopolyspora rectivirgula]|uniref:hypothetical protein n=1 Tax=Saccharopolyspora rectivirgula TaxID=28042 RepID=UPI001267D1CC|nr:hypothetical protein [Saccharopolyspora rectivirgula]